MGLPVRAPASSSVATSRSWRDRRGAASARRRRALSTLAAGSPSARTALRSPRLRPEDGLACRRQLVAASHQAGDGSPVPDGDPRAEAGAVGTARPVEPVRQLEPLLAPGGDLVPVAGQAGVEPPLPRGDALTVGEGVALAVEGHLVGALPRPVEERL